MTHIEMAYLRDHADYSPEVAEEVLLLRGRIALSGLPEKVSDRNLTIGAWNIRSLSRVHPAWQENPGSPKRNWRAMAYLVEVVRRMEVVAVQEVRRDLEALNLLAAWLGSDWGVAFTDVDAGASGNAERLAFLYDRRRVRPSGLAGGIVLPPTEAGDPVRQSARAPYAVGFQAGEERFVLVTTHILYGRDLTGREEEVRAFAGYAAEKMRDHAVADRAEANLIVLGDFNIEKRGDDPLYQAFRSTGLMVPAQLEHLTTAFGTEPKFYDQIARFEDALSVRFNGHAGVVDFTGAVYREMSLRSMSYRVWDHFPLWMGFLLDRSREELARTLSGT